MADSDKLPTIQEWLGLTEEERRRQVDSWDPYIGEGEALLEEIVEHLRRELSQFPDLKVGGVGIYHGGSWVIDVVQPSMCDRRLPSETYLGVRLCPRVPGPILPDFDAGDV